MKNYATCNVFALIIPKQSQKFVFLRKTQDWEIVVLYKCCHRQDFFNKILLFAFAYRKGSKNFWSFVKQMKNTASQTIPTLLSNDEIFTNPVDKANLFADLFASNSNLPDSSQPPPELERVSCTMPEIHFRTRVVKRVLLGLNVNKSTGPDGISAQVLKKCA